MTTQFCCVHLSHGIHEKYFSAKTLYRLYWLYGCQILRPIYRGRQTVRARAPADLFLGRGCPGHGEFRLSDGLIHTSRSIVGRASQVGPLGRRSLQQLAARTALSGTDRVFHCRAGYCTRPPPQPTLGPRWHQRIQRPVPSAAIAGIQMN